MGKLQKNESGFSAIEAVLIVIIIVLVGVAGWLVYKNHHKTSINSNKEVSNSAETSTQNTNFVNVIQDNDSVIQVSPEKIAKTNDEIGILVALHNRCIGQTNSQVSINHVVFDGNSNFIQDGNYAVINAGVCSPKGKTLDEVFTGGSNNYLHKNSAGVWIFDASSQMAPACSKVDGLGYPTDIISNCLDGSTERAPK